MRRSRFTEEQIVAALTEQFTRRIAKNASEWLRDPWALEERTQDADYGVADKRTYAPDGFWDIDRNLDAQDADLLINGIVAQLLGHVLTVVSPRGEERGVRLIAGALRWPGPRP